MISTAKESTLDTGFAHGFMEATRAYLAHDSAPVSHRAARESESGMVPVPVIERGTGPRQMLHMLWTGSK